MPLPALNPRLVRQQRLLRTTLIGLAWLALAVQPAAATFPLFDFTTAAGVSGWKPTHDLASLQASPTGLVATISGSDPYFTGPTRDFPPDVPLWMNVRLRSDTAGTAQVFYFVTSATEEQSVRFAVPGNVWYDARLPMPPLGSRYRLRFDPPGVAGQCVLARIAFEERVILEPPAWPQPTAPNLGAFPLSVSAGALRLVHGAGGPGEFEIQVEDEPIAVGHNRPLLGYHAEGDTHWLPLSPGPDRTFNLTSRGSGISAALSARDPQGCLWTFRQDFAPGTSNAIRVTTTVLVDRDREAVFVPMFMMLPGLGTFGTNKHQALLPGVEYLENEPSSSEADVRGPGANRLAADTLKLTMPLMALETAGRYVGCIWKPSPEFCALFDSPDRLFGSDAHLLGLIAPGSDGFSRDEGQALPYGGLLLRPNQPLRLEAILIGATGDSVVPAVQQYVALRGLPAIPDPGVPALDYYRLAAHGWLDSGIRDGHRFRHAYWPGFDPQPAADAALWMDWLALHVEDNTLAGSLRTVAAGARSLVAPSERNQSGVGHVRYPAPALAYGAVAENADTAASRGQARLAGFQGDGVVLYKPPAGGTDYSATHWSKEANGLVGGALLELLQDAAFSGNPTLRAKALQHLRALSKFRHSVPRGAQTWEIPLHTPDILAAAHLVRVHVLGYELSGDPMFLEEARYWAWTGVPFVYLSPPTPGPVGLYNTIPVLGATGWVAPLWIGLPVQWCGLVYGQALRELAPYDPDGPWLQIANGIAAAGIQHTWPLSDPDRQGLLPDVFALRPQMRDGPPINPATVQSQAVPFYSGPPVYARAAFLRHGLMVHATGQIEVQSESSDGVAFRIASWAGRNTWVLVTGCNRTPAVRLNGTSIPLSPPHQYSASKGRLILSVPSDCRVEIDYPSLAALTIEPLPEAAIRIRWPAAGSNLVLTSSSTLLPHAQWMPAAGPVAPTGAWCVVTNPITGPLRFYRLAGIP
ncbi:MAG TPA: hypothetical protein PKM73_20915 [Verrucomicrobiota bacterium]|nr:hypothetical protein [Verrucomicrobiota bacterium]